jgi:hypothetical protein
MEKIHNVIVVFGNKFYIKLFYFSGMGEKLEYFLEEIILIVEMFKPSPYCYQILFLSHSKKGIVSQDFKMDLFQILCI